MTERKRSSKSTEESAPKEDAPSTVTAEPRYTRERLMTDSVAFTGHPAHVLAGALHGDDRNELTVADAKQAITAWLGE